MENKYTLEYLKQFDGSIAFGVKFESDNNISYRTYMDNYVGKPGTIYLLNNPSDLSYLKLEFEDGKKIYYPTELIINQFEKVTSEREKLILSINDEIKLLDAIQLQELKNYIHENHKKLKTKSHVNTIYINNENISLEAIHYYDLEDEKFVPFYNTERKTHRCR